MYADPSRFIQNVSDAKDLADIDALCFSWLRSAAEEYGQAGMWAGKLLGLAEEMMQ